MCIFHVHFVVAVDCASVSVLFFVFFLLYRHYPGFIITFSLHKEADVLKYFAPSDELRWTVSTVRVGADACAFPVVAT